jgi:hypothetical protein
MKPRSVPISPFGSTRLHGLRQPASGRRAARPVTQPRRRCVALGNGVATALLELRAPFAVGGNGDSEGQLESLGLLSGRLLGRSILRLSSAEVAAAGASSTPSPATALGNGVLPGEVPSIEGTKTSGVSESGGPRLCCQSVCSRHCGDLLLNIARSERAGAEFFLEHMFRLRTNLPLPPTQLSSGP